MKRFKNYFDLISKIVQYNLKIIFANKFLYIFLVSIFIFLFVTTINLIDSESNPNEGSVYYILLVPGLLLISYPTIFGIQNDVDSRMLEILFGIPNYRYKVWLLRMAIIYFIMSAILLVLSLLSSVALVAVPVFKMVYQLMFPIFFLGSIAFMFSTLIRNGYGTAVVMVIIGLIFWILSGTMPTSKYNLFLNPFNTPSEVNEAIWAEKILYNRIYLFVGTIVAILYGLLNLQRREKFI